MTTNPLKLFNLDLHISVIEDIKDICQRIFGDRVEITNWSISGHNWVFDKPTPSVYAINQHTWRSINHQMIYKFHQMYDSFLEEFDGFVVTHTPVFAMLFEKYGKPILIVNTCRYNQPFCWQTNPQMQQALDDCLIRLTASGQGKLVSNNAADYLYLYEKTGLKSEVLPSLCLYTNATHTPTHPEFVIHGRTEAFPTHSLLIPKPNSGYSWKDLYSYKAIIHAPYEMSTMSIFEQLWAGVPLFFPTKRFYKECIEKGTMEFISIYEKWDHPLTEAEVDKWLELADFYLYPVFYYYDSMDDLITQINEFTDPKREERLKWIAENREAILQRWKGIFKDHFKI